MDPNANLAELLDLANTATTNGELMPHDAARMGELVLALDEWLTSQGFLPTRWAARQEEGIKLAGRRAFEEGRRQGIELVASAVKKTLTVESLDNLIAALKPQPENSGTEPLGFIR